MFTMKGKIEVQIPHNRTGIDKCYFLKVFNRIKVIKNYSRKFSLIKYNNT